MSSRITVALAACCLVTFLSSTARADQCAWIDKGTATEAAQYIGLYGFGGTIVHFCEPCGDQAPVPEEVLSVEIRPASDEYWEVYVNGSPVDLAYAFIGDRSDGGFSNLSKLVSCPSDGVSSCLDANLDSVPDCAIEGSLEMSDGNEDDWGSADVYDSGSPSEAAGGCSVAGGSAGANVGLFVVLGLALVTLRRRFR